MIRVILIDDEADALNLLEILLNQVGNVEITGKYLNPIQAIEALNETMVDGVFLDIQMPGMKGTEVARRIRSISPELPIIFTTAYAEYALEAFEIDSTDYLLKPFTVGRLENAVARIMKNLYKQTNLEQPSVPAVPSVQALGGFHIFSPLKPSSEVVWKTKKERELCAFLIHHEGRRVNASFIIEALWPEHDLDKAKSYLYTCLSYLRRSLTDQGIPIHIHKGNSGFSAELNNIKTDISLFETLLNQILNEEKMDEKYYNQMNKMYTGDYMHGCNFDWAIARQLELNSLYVRVLRKWSMYYLSQEKFSLAVDSLQRLLTIFPDSEIDGRALIRLHLELGNRSEAYRVCLQLEQAVRVQLGTELEEETMLLVRQTKERQSAQLNES
ncbi:response regulator [Paenibacillus silvae]|uniref:response regulator n=1 Tax=Paenibacillus silvae TaxID=1325358 RepID=UPI002005FD0F|nr:response regulator [Paenibacillus silvae]MCK6077525.1 response regulator [Paenibacillus silvae]MCK6151743.1 response regulator [Paenibacillus silvae]MCK6270229.1 response regulator [Paenibacillus silvae]